MMSLEQRHKSERQFYDRVYEKRAKRDYYQIGVKSIIYSRMLEKLGDLEGKKVVDYGCGSGWQTRLLYEKGAYVWAFDIAEEAVKRIKEKASHLEWKDRIQVDQMPAENLIYEDNSFDIIVGNAILHHLDLSLAIPEIHRVLKDNGKAFFMEPLGHNPFINCYRKLTPNKRTKGEKPLCFESFDIIRKSFSKFEHEEFYLITLFAFLVYFIFRNDKLFLKTRDLLYRIDRIILEKKTFINKHCWYSLLVMEK